MSRKNSISNLRATLVKRREALRKIMASIGLNELHGQQPPGNMIDGVMEADQNEVNSKLAEVQSQELVLIGEALERIQAGTFGICMGCGNEILLPRLIALPYATRCVGCQRLAEREATLAGAASS